MRFREALQSVDLEEVFRLINEKDNSYEYEDSVPIETTTKAYKKVVRELLKKPKVRSYHMPWLIKDVIEGDEVYVDVCLLNRKYVEPKKGLKPWGGKNPPKGHYNVNLNKHSKYFSAGFLPWSKTIDTQIVNETKHSLEKVVAEILWELTFYGFTEKKVEKESKNLKKLLDKRVKEVDEGKFVEFPSSKDGEDKFKILIAEGALKDILEIGEKKNKKK